jgi:NAD-dependent dihydropyrimidine dehydrogenase PreA subunit
MVSTTLARRPLDLEFEQFRVPRGQIFIIPNRCKDCQFCIEFCPADVLERSSQINAKGYHYPVVAEGKEEGCVNCRFCMLVCPEFAIYSSEVQEGTRGDA